jgi:hypothetical protein
VENYRKQGKVEYKVVAVTKKKRRRRRRRRERNI